MFRDLVLLPVFWCAGHVGLMLVGLFVRGGNLNFILHTACRAVVLWCVSMRSSCCREGNLALAAHLLFTPKVHLLESGMRWLDVSSVQGGHLDLAGVHFAAVGPRLGRDQLVVISLLSARLRLLSMCKTVERRRHVI